MYGNTKLFEYCGLNRSVALCHMVGFISQSFNCYNELFLLLCRWKKSLDPARTRKGYFTPDEDIRLKIAVLLFGPKNWNKKAEFLPGRNQVQCRERCVKLTYFMPCFYLLLLFWGEIPETRHPGIGFLIYMDGSAK